MPGPDDSGPASVPHSSAGVFDEDAPPSSGPVSARDADEGAPPPSGTRARMHAAILAFVSSRKDNEGRDFVTRVVKARLGADIPRAMLEDIVQATLTEAVECRWPPWFASKVPAWLARLTRRQITAYFRKEQGRQDEKKNKKKATKKPDPTARPRDARSRNLESAKLDARTDGADGGHFERVEPAARTEWIADRSSPPTDERARARLLHDWLATQIGDSPAKVHTLGLLKEHEVDGFTLGELAKRERTTERALANRFHKLRKELEPKVRLLDDEKTRRSVLWLLLLLGATAVLALALWLLGVLSPARPAPSFSPALPVPSVSAVAPPPVFDQALPAPSAPAPPPSPPVRDKP
jgi:DNA-directed RNA polymerase specialized sigma24 family protein